MGYKEAFKSEMYRHISEDFRDSFTPGSSSSAYRSKRPIMIPMSYFNEKARIVEATLARRGLKRPSDVTMELLSKEVFGEKLSASSIEEVQQMIDSGSWTPNPSTPKIPAEMYEDLQFFHQFFGSDALKANPIKAASPQELMRQFKSSSMHMTQLFLRQRMKLAPEDFEFQEGSTLSDHKRVVLNQYRRYFVGMVIANLVRKAYEMSPSDIDAFLAITGIPQMPLKDLEKKSNRRGFAVAVTKTMEALFGAQDLGKAILAQVAKMSRQKKIPHQS